MSGGGQQRQPASEAPKLINPPLPTLGRIVHHMRDGRTRAAIITEVLDDYAVGLNVFRNYGETAAPEPMLSQSDLRNIVLGYCSAPPELRCAALHAIERNFGISAK